MFIAKYVAFDFLDFAIYTAASDKIILPSGIPTIDTACIADVAITNDVEIQKSNVSSIGGAIGGAVLFGPLGSMIGGRSKEKTSNIVTSYLVFTYLDHDEIKYISFNCTNDFKAMKFVKEFKQNNQKINSDIDL